MDQPGTHEPRIQQHPHETEPLSEQTRQQARLPFVARQLTVCERFRGDCRPLDLALQSLSTNPYFLELRQNYG